MNKKAVTPIIGTLLLILLSVALGGIIFVFIRNYNINLQTNLSQQAECRDYSFSAGDVCSNSTTNNSKNGIILQFDAVNYSPNINLTGFRISISYEGSGNFKTIEFDSLIPSTQTRNIASSFIEGTNQINRISIFPRISINNKDFICEEKEKVVVGTEIKSC